MQRSLAMEPRPHSFINIPAAHRRLRSALAAALLVGTATADAQAIEKRQRLLCY
jgi:hypothetical protein